MFIAPVTVGFMLDTIITIGKVLHTSGVVEFPSENIGQVPFCTNGYDWDSRTQPECLTVGYSMIGDSNDINDPKY